MAAENRRAVEAPQVVRILKSDSFGRVELLDGPDGRCARRVTCGGRLPGSRLVARMLAGRERRALRHLAGLVGVPPLPDLPAYAAAPSPDGSVPRAADVLLRGWMEGEPLWSVSRLPEDFFERLEDLVRDLHDRGVCHNDLHKEPNVLVDPDGRPALVDFQLASVHPRGGSSLATRAGEDMRQVAKHRERYTRHTGRALDAAGSRRRKRRSLLAGTWMLCGKPVYNFVVRGVLGRKDGEPRRPSAGPWPRWTPPIGPRSR